MDSRDHLKMDRVMFDVAIIGGGPGGSAAALALRAHASSLSVVLIEASSYETARIGETLPPQGRSILEHLGVWEAFQAQRHREVYGTTAAWGSSTPLDNDFIYMPGGAGWHLDRAEFDAMLAAQAERQGAALRLNTRLRQTERVKGSWRLTLSEGGPLSAKFIVDATGGAGLLARRLGAHFIDSDKLVGIARFFERSPTSGQLVVAPRFTNTAPQALNVAPELTGANTATSWQLVGRSVGRDSYGRGDDPRTLVEAFEDGWWYTAGLPDGGRIIACMTDADIARGLRLSHAEQWLRTLTAMPNVGLMLRGSTPCGPLVVRSSQSRRLEPAGGDHWLAVGDAASRFDPLSSQGIIKALRSGVFAAYAISDLLIRNADSGVRRYLRYVAEEFTSYTETRQKYYLQEQRWPASEFWRRRHAPG